jgi:hypothetical protein
MLLAQAAVALITGHLLPGLLLARGLRLGRTTVERSILAAILGGPVAAVVYLISLLLESSSLYWLLLAGLNIASIFFLLRGRKEGDRLPREPVASRRVWIGLVGLIIVIGLAYAVSTGTSFRYDGEGNLLMDRALQRDTLYHVGMVRSLESSYPPELLSTSGVEVHYHALYHLQLAGWARHFGMDVFDAVYRVGALWSLILLILSSFLLGRRFAGNDVGGLLAALLVFGTGLGFLFFWTPSADWWSSSFLDVTLVSVLLPNPLLSALALLFAGLACLDDYLDSRKRGALAGSAVILACLFQVKVFLGAQALGGILVAAVLRWRSSKLRTAALVHGIVALPFVIGVFFGAEGGNTAVRLRPLEIVRYSMEKLDWTNAARALADFGKGELSSPALVLLATLLWAMGFLGLRLIGLPRLVRDARDRPLNVRSPMAYAVLIGIPVAMVFRIAPAEATGLSRLEAINDVIWFAAQSGVLLWFWTVESLQSLAQKRPLGPLAASGLVVFLALPGTIQHFFYRVSLGDDVIAAERIEAAQRVRELSAPGEVWVEPLNRVRPSLAAYIAGRPVVYDGFVGYDYMFVPRDEIDYRRHSLAQFWRTKDPAYVRWFSSHFSVSGVSATEEAPLPAAARESMQEAFSNDSCRVYRVVRNRPGSDILQTPTRLPMGLSGASYYGRGWGRPSGSPRTRRLLPGRAVLYVPVESGVDLTVRLELAVPHTAGTLELGDDVVTVGSEQTWVDLVRPRFEKTGLQAIEIQWDGPKPLTVRRIDLDKR